MSSSPHLAHSGPKAAAARWVLWVALALAVLSCLPVVVARYPQMSDYPAHLARYAVMLDAGRSADLARYYSFEWRWTGNVGVDLLIRPFAALFGLEAGGRLIAGLIAPLTGFGLLACEWVLRRRIGPASLLAFAFIWSPMMLIGLMNYALGQALALLGFALWVALAHKSWRWAVFVPVGLIVWLCHLSAWGVLGLLVFGYEWCRHKDWRPFVAPWPLLAPLVVMVLVPGTSSSFSYGPHWWVYKQAIWMKAMRDTVYPLDFLGLVVVASAVLGAVVFRRIDRRLGWAALALVIGSIAVPRHISGGDYADYRLVTTGLMVACLAIDWPMNGKVARVLLLAAPALFLARLAVTTQSWAADSARTGELLQALDHVPRGARVASAVLVPRDVWQLQHFEHIGAYAVVRRHAWSNANFAVANVHMLHLTPAAPRFADPSQRLLQTMRQPVDLARFAPAAHADYLWYVGDKSPASLPVGAVVIWRSRHSLLARLANRAQAD